MEKLQLARIVAWRHRVKPCGPSNVYIRIICIAPKEGINILSFYCVDENMVESLIIKAFLVLIQPLLQLRA